MLFSIAQLGSDPIGVVAGIVAIIVAITVHEFAHAYVALWQGDDTAERMGRVSLNPLKHLDLIGTVMLLLVGFGWGKPVPVDVRNLKHQKWSGVLVALAGPVSNIMVAAIAGLVLRFTFIHLGVENGLVKLLASLTVINIVLAVFNIIPIPPLDGSKVLFVLLPDTWRMFKIHLSQLGPFLLIFMVFIGLPMIGGAVDTFITWTLQLLCSCLY